MLHYEPRRFITSETIYYSSKTTKKALDRNWKANAEEAFED